MANVMTSSRTCPLTLTFCPGLSNSLESSFVDFVGNTIVCNHCPSASAHVTALDGPCYCDAHAGCSPFMANQIP